MRRWMLVLACLAGLAAKTEAGPNAQGTVSLHWNSSIAFTGDAYCPDGGLVACAHLVDQAPPAVGPFPLPEEDGAQKRIWFAYALFPPESRPRLRGVVFGIAYRNFDGASGVKLLWASCPTGSVEIPSPIPPWPAPNSGTSLVLPETLTGLTDEIYAFAGYGTQGEIFALGPHPTHPAQFADNAVPPHLDDIVGFGTLGFGVPGQPACVLTPLGACCAPDGSCQYLLSEQCATGDWREGVLCDPNPCPQPPRGACCYPDGHCTFVVETGCTTGDWREGVACTPNPCPQLPRGACCHPNGYCSFVTETECLPAVWFEGVPCAPNPCPQPPPGACCRSNGQCTYVTEAQCTTGDWRQGVSCTPNPCPQPPGACCYPDGRCTFVAQTDCPSGVWDQGVPCSPNPCPVPTSPNANGTLILHYHSSINASCDPEAFQGRLGDCEEAVVQAPAATGFPVPCQEAQVWYAYAAFPPGSSPRLRGVQFGIEYAALTGGEGVRILYTQSPPGCVEIPTTVPAWPLPGSGTSVALSQTATGLIAPVYSFTGYGSPGQTVTLRDHPNAPAQFADDSVPPRLDRVVAFGNLGFGVDGFAPCPETSLGACCFTDEHCEVLTVAQCGSAGGNWLGHGVPCTPNPCTNAGGSCCYPDGHCTYVPRASCPYADWRLDLPCTPNPCPVPPPSGACCFNDGSCRYIQESQCGSGDWREGVLCSPNPCPQPPPLGACCDLESFRCEIMTETECSEQSYAHMWMEGEDCNPWPCPVPPPITGACCNLTTGACTILTEEECSGQGYPHQWIGPNTLCVPNPCPTPSHTGACCNMITAVSGRCQILSAVQCAALSVPHQYMGDGTVCDPSPCPEPFGACCLATGGCSFLGRDACYRMNGRWLGGACVPNPCPRKGGKGAGD